MKIETLPVMNSAFLAESKALSSSCVHSLQLDLTEEHVSQVYCVSREEVRTRLPHGLPKTFATQVQ